MIDRNKLSLCFIIVGILFIIAVIFDLPCKTILASGTGAVGGMCIGLYILSRSVDRDEERRYSNLYMVANNALGAYGKAILFNPNTMRHDLKNWPMPEPMEGTVAVFIDTIIPPFIQKLSDFKDNVYGIVAALGTEALIKTNFPEGKIRLEMLMMMQEQAVRDCEGAWLYRDGRENLRISIDNIMHVFFEWTDIDDKKPSED